MLRRQFLCQLHSIVAQVSFALPRKTGGLSVNQAASATETPCRFGFETNRYAVRMRPKGTVKHMACARCKRSLRFECEPPHSLPHSTRAATRRSTLRIAANVNEVRGLHAKTRACPRVSSMGDDLWIAEEVGRAGE